ncbi:MAG: lipoxygenase family protein [Byssovorax sp.]
MSSLKDLRPRPPTLPQDDGDQEGRQAELEAAREAYQYAYDKPNIRGLAMTASLPDEARPSPPYLAAVAEAVAEIFANAGKIDGRPDATGRAALIEAVRTGGIKAALTAVQTTAFAGTRKGPVERLSDYAAMFAVWPAPVESTDHFLDSTFARMRLSGPNPAWLRRVDPKVGVPDDLGVQPAHYQAAIPGGDTLDAALAEGRLFLCEYRELAGLTAGSAPVPDKISIDYEKDPSGWDAAYKAREASYASLPAQKALVAPLALFAVPAGMRTLVPVAIQLFPDGHGGQKHRVFTPRDGMDWLAAKCCVQAADGTVHETMSHLGRTHIVQEAFCLAMHNCLSPRHPLHRLLAPHFEGTNAINAAADHDLVSPGGGVDALVLPTIGGSIQLTGKAVTGLDFNADMFPRRLAARGVDTDGVIDEYPYRDDGQLVWQAIERFVTGYVHAFYPSDAEVGADAELQQFVRQVGERDAADARGRRVGGGIKGVGEGGARVETRGYLVAMLTQIIWNGSAEHAAVNFPQADPMSFAPLYPLALMAPPPTGSPVFEKNYMAMLPHYDTARLQLGILRMLGSVHYTKLGHYTAGPGWFIGAAGDLARAFARDLDDVERTIEERNRTRRPYIHLLPSRIPQSINI